MNSTTKHAQRVTMPDIPAAPPWNCCRLLTQLNAPMKLFHEKILSEATRPKQYRGDEEPDASLEWKMTRQFPHDNGVIQASIMSGVGSEKVQDLLLLDVTLSRYNNITIGKLYQSVLEKERRGDSLGKTVQVVPHITDAIKNCIESGSSVPIDGKNDVADVCVIESGGMVGDIEPMPFNEDLLQLSFSMGKENFCLVHMSLVLAPQGNKLPRARPELMRLHATVDRLNHLSKFYKRENPQFLVVNDMVSKQCSVSSSRVNYISNYHRFGWLLFLALRNHAFSRSKNLVACTNGLVSILAIFIIHAPKHIRNLSMEDSSIAVKKSDKGIYLLASLCHVYNTSEDDLRRTVENAKKLIEDILKEKPEFASVCRSESFDCIDTEGLTFFIALLKEKSLESNLFMFEKDYHDASNSKGDLDECIFASDEESSFSNRSLPGCGSNLLGTRFGALASPTTIMSSSCFIHPATSPGNGNITVEHKMVASTLVSSAKTIANWLRSVISPLPLNPSAELEQFFSSCGGDVISHATHRANIILEAIFPSISFGEHCISGILQTAKLLDNTWVEERKLEALKLYYRVLGTICRAESKTEN